ncbi:MAG: tryptophan synthase subunit alpha [Alphaproteobacteria bacterium]
MNRIKSRFVALSRENRAAFVPFITAGDPDPETSFAILERLPASGADIIELGVPFSDPMADGPTIQASSLRALKAGTNLQTVLSLVKRFRARDTNTPIVLMGYFNPIHAYGVEQFAKDAAAAGADGVIVVDLPPEEDRKLRTALAREGLDVVRLATPTADERRLRTILDGASGFLYYVSITGITGSKTLDQGEVASAVARMKRVSRLPIAVGFGIKTPEHAAAVACIADGAVIGSAVVNRVAECLEAKKAGAALAEDVAACCESLAKAVHGARAKC